MTENEWLLSDDPTAMLDYAGGKASQRKLRLFAIACSRRIRIDMCDEDIRKSIEIAEYYADDPIYNDRLESVSRILRSPHPITLQSAIQAAYSLAERAVRKASIDAFWPVLAADPSSEQADTVERAAVFAHRARILERRSLASLLRDIFGNPFRPLVLEPMWLTEEVIDMAGVIYDNKEFVLFPKLGEALEKANCDDPQVQIHCHHLCTHVRGCWLLDAILGKEPGKGDTGKRGHN